MFFHSMLAIYYFGTKHCCVCKFNLLIIKMYMFKFRHLRYEQNVGMKTVFFRGGCPKQGIGPGVKKVLYQKMYFVLRVLACLIFKMFAKSNILKERKCHQLVFVKDFLTLLAKL